jgi:hypothetical protein
MVHSRPTLAVATAGAIIVGAVCAVIAVADPPSGGGTQVQMENRSGLHAPVLHGSTGTTFHPWAAGPSVSGSVPSGGLVVNARFTASSRCDGIGVPGHCSIRLMATPASGAPTELDPVTGTVGSSFFAFDAHKAGVAQERPKSYAMERSVRLTDPGSYAITVEYAISKASLRFWLRYWHLAVETSA